MLAFSVRKLEDRWRAALILVGPLVLCSAATALLLIVPPAVPRDTSFDLDLAAVRRLARSPDERLPVRVNAIIVAESIKPMIGALGGCRTDSFAMPWTVFQVLYEDSFLLIDSAADATLHRDRAPGGTFHADRFAATQEGLRSATAVLFTHEHPDHLGGVARSPHLAALAPRIRLTREQLANTAALRAAGLSPAAAAVFEPLDYDRRLRVAAGVVLIKAPGHTPGSQIVYVHLRSGIELLLVGDIAWHRTHFESPRGHPLLSAWLLGEDLPAVLGQLRALHDAWRTEQILVVPSHDGEHLRRLIAAGILGSELVLTPRRVPGGTAGPAAS